MIYYLTYLTSGYHSYVLLGWVRVRISSDYVLMFRISGSRMKVLFSKSVLFVTNAKFRQNFQCGLTKVA
jgi:hypothetical protein